MEIMLDGVSRPFSSSAREPDHLGINIGTSMEEADPNLA
jgi:hypothetical protein